MSLSFHVLPVSRCCLTVAVHLGKHEHTLLAFWCCPFPCSAPDFPGRSAQGCSCCPLGPAGDPAQAPELALCQECDLLDQVEGWMQRKLCANYAGTIADSNAYAIENWYRKISVLSPGLPRIFNEVCLWLLMSRSSLVISGFSSWSLKCWWGTAFILLQQRL